jgi:tape measure domain-containing protein
MASNEDISIRTRLLGVMQFVRDASLMSKSLNEVEKSSKRASTNSSRLWSRAFSSIGRGLGGLSGRMAAFRSTVLFDGTLGVAAFLKAGISFEAFRERTMVGFQKMLGGSRIAATNLWNILAKIALTTPFNIRNITEGTRRLMAFGFSAPQALKSIKTIGDAAAALGGGNTTLDRMILAIGEIQARGRVSSRELNQLSYAGLQSYKILENALHLTPAQLKKALRAGAVSSDVAIPALMDWMFGHYHGQARAQSFKTIGGLWSNVQDSFDQAAGKFIRRFQPQIKTFLIDMQNFLQSKGFQKDLTDIGKLLVQVGGAVWDIVKAFLKFWDGLSPSRQKLLIKVIAAFILLSPIILELLSMGAAFGPWGVIIVGAVLAIAGAAIYAYAHWKWFRTAVDWTWQELKKLWHWIVTVGYPIFMVWWNKYISPFFQNLWTALKGWGPALKLVFDLIAGVIRHILIPVVSVIIRDLKSVIRWAKTAIGWAKTAYGWFTGAKGNKMTPQQKRMAPVHLGHAQTGGYASGPTLVGEMGPEILYLPPNAKVQAANSPGSILQNVGGPSMVTTQIYLDKKKIAEAVSQVRDDRLARS